MTKRSVTSFWAKLSITVIVISFARAIALVSASPPVTIPNERADEILISYPTPEYPIEARARHLTGKGVFEVQVDAPTGKITAVLVVRSTGVPILDRAATDGLKRWKFRPNKVSRIRLPITFTM